MTREEKSVAIKEIVEVLKSNQNIYLADISGLNALETSNLRRMCFKAGVKLSVVKNTLLEKAMDGSEKDFGDLKSQLVGNTALMFSETGNAPAKVIKKFRKNFERPILKGAFIAISDLAKNLNIDVSFEFMSISSYEGSESTGQIKIEKDLDIDISGKNILIVEDIFDTGLTLSSLIDILESRNPKSIEIMCMFVKSVEKKIPVKIKYKGFEIGSEFVVGYGLDYMGKYRELPYLAELS